MKLEVKGKKKGTRGNINFESATIVVTDATVDLSQFTDSSAPGVKISIGSATDTVIQYEVEVRGRRNIGIDDVVSAVITSLRGDQGAIRKKLGIP